MRRVMIFCLVLLAGLLSLLAGPAWTVMSGEVEIRRGWRNADRSSAGLAPNPATTPEAIVQVYGARTVSWRGAFAVHTWVAAKPANASHYTRYEVIGWRARGGNSAVVVTSVVQPDTAWFGAAPDLLFDLRGEAAQALLPAIEAAVHSYPWPREYTAWPGPNSNSFVAWIARNTPGLSVDLPPTAVGKDYLGSSVIAKTTSGSGYQISLGGLLGLTLARDEGVELLILGLGIGVDPLGPALRLPGIGRVGWE